MIDSIGEPIWSALGEFLRPGGRMVSYGRTAGSVVSLEIARFFHAQWTLPRHSQRQPGGVRLP